MIITQLIILIFGGVSIWLLGRKEKWRRWGYIVGMCSQPFWLYTTFVNKQWGIFILACFCVYSWAQGIYNFWIKNEKTNQT